MNHFLFPIGQSIWEIVREKSIFRNLEFKNVLSFLDQFDQIDNNSTAFRYNVTKKGDAQKLHDNQWWLDVFNLFIAVRDICNEIDGYSNSEDFDNDSLGQYTEEFLNDVEQKKMCFNRFVELMTEAGFAGDVNDDFNSENLFDRLKLYADKKDKLKQLLHHSGMSDEDICDACMGMYFGRDGHFPFISSSKEATNKLIEKGMNNLLRYQNRLLEKIYKIKLKIEVKK